MTEKDETDEKPIESELGKFLKKHYFIEEFLPTKEIIPEEVTEITLSGEMPKLARLKYLRVEMSDWERIERYLSNLNPISSNWQIALGASLGILVNSFFGLIGTLYISNLPSFINSILLAFLIGSFIASIILAISLRDKKKGFTASVELITDEMKNIKKKNNSLDNG